LVHVLGSEEERDRTLRLTDQSKTRKVLADAERERMAIGPRPWDEAALT
jgi:hypothetical protein